MRDPYGDGGRGQEREGGWTVDGPNKALGVQFKGLSLLKGKKASMKVTHPHPDADPDPCMLSYIVSSYLILSYLILSYLSYVQCDDII